MRAVAAALARRSGPSCRKPTIAASKAQPEVIQYAMDASWASTMIPANGDETASPTARPADGQDIDSVSREAGTIRSINAIPEISTGATATPATPAPIASSQIVLSQGSGSATTPSTASTNRNWRSSEARSFSVPKIRPPARDPSEFTASSSPAMPL